MVDAYSTPDVDSIPMKMCSTCRQSQPFDAFSRSRKSRDGKCYTCRTCAITRSQASYRANRESRRVKSKAYRAANRERIKAQRKAYRQANRARIQAFHAAYRQANRERLQAYYDANRAQRNASAKSWNAANQEYLRAWSRARYKNNPAPFMAKNARRRAAKRAASRNDLTAAQWQTIKAHYGFRCVYCDRKMQRLTQDHITPLSKGGAHTYSNIVPACASCNSKKSTGAPLKPVQPLLLC